MLELVPLQLVDNFLLDYHFGHVFVLLLGLSILGVLPLGSPKALALNLGAFGLLFLLTPIDLFGGEALFKLLAIPLLVVAPLLFAFGRE